MIIESVVVTQSVTYFDKRSDAEGTNKNQNNSI